MNFGPAGPYPNDTYVYLALRHYGKPRQFLYGIPTLYAGYFPHASPDPRHPEKEDEYDDFRAHTHLDAITERLFEEERHDPLDSFFSAKKEFLGRSVEDILGLIYEREQMRYDHFQLIDYDSCKAMTRLNELWHWHPGTNATADRARANAERELFAFEREKRMEDVACWRDVARLKTELREVMREWSQEKQKESFLASGASAKVSHPPSHDYAPLNPARPPHESP